jgi:hypothetical protein
VRQKIGSGLLSTLGVVLALSWGVAFLLVEFGGISYRKDCITSQGELKKAWTFTWFAPLPFVFRPSQQGCKVHTGARVALDALGLFPFRELSLASAAREASNDPSLDANQKYYALLFANLTDLHNWNAAHPRDYEGGITKLRQSARALDQLAPPNVVAGEHHQLVTLFRSAATSGQRLLAANASHDQATALRLATRLDSANTKQASLLAAITRKLQHN